MEAKDGEPRGTTYTCGPANLKVFKVADACYRKLLVLSREPRKVSTIIDVGASYAKKYIMLISGIVDPNGKRIKFADLTLVRT
jgi:hypothetical protein